MGVDPCTLSDDTQVQGLGFDPSGRLDDDPELVQCLFRGPSPAFLGVAIDVTIGFDDYARPSADKVVTPTQIGPYRSVALTRNVAPTVCVVVIDVGAAGQVLTTQIDDGRNAPDQNCAIAAQLATTAVGKLS